MFLNAILNKVGIAFIEFINSIGRIICFIYNVVKAMFTPRFYCKDFLKQLLEIGYYSLPVVGLTAIFTGAVLALQTYTGFSRMHAEGVVASVVVLSITRELGPVLAGLMLAGRLSSSIAAELGTMRVTEQIDALYTLKTNPIKYLVVPRVWGGIIMFPLLVLIADIIAVFGGYLISVYRLGFNSYIYITRTFDYLQLHDVVSGLIKAGVFGFIVFIMGCYHGYNSRGGAHGVGDATTNAVVSSSILILLFNYLMTGILFTN